MYLGHPCRARTGFKPPKEVEIQPRIFSVNSEPYDVSATPHAVILPPTCPLLRDSDLA